MTVEGGRMPVVDQVKSLRSIVMRAAQPLPCSVDSIPQQETFILSATVLSDQLVDFTKDPTLPTFP
eukprot:scaffold217315_cov41-Attheya_sp.AAC.1